MHNILDAYQNEIKRIEVVDPRDEEIYDETMAYFKRKNIEINRKFIHYRLDNPDLELAEALTLYVKKLG